MGKIISYKNNILIEQPIDSSFKIEDKTMAPFYISDESLNVFKLNKLGLVNQYHRYEKLDSKETELCYLTSHELELNYKRSFTEPFSQKIVEQGRWECAPASLAMLINEPLRTIKKELVKLGWNNDDYGCGSKMILEVAKKLGHNLILTSNVFYFEKCFISVPSVNMKDKSHALCWNGEEILDPNLYNEKRKHYSPEWTLNSILRNPLVIRYKRENE